MINPIGFNSFSPLAGRSNNYNYTSTSFGSSYSDALLGIGMQLLLIAVVKQQLQAFTPVNSNASDEGEENTNDAPQVSPNKNDTQGSNQILHNHCYSNDQEPEHEEEEPEPDEVQVLQGLVNQLQQQTAYQSAMQQSHHFNNYLSTSFSDQQIIRSIQLEGGKVLRQYDSFFLAEDSSGNRYSVSRNPSLSIDN